MLSRSFSSAVVVTTGLVDTFSIPQLMRLVATERLDPSLFATHRFPLDDTMTAYDAFGDAAKPATARLLVVGARGLRGLADRCPCRRVSEGVHAELINIGNRSR